MAIYRHWKLDRESSMLRATYIVVLLVLRGKVLEANQQLCLDAHLINELHTCLRTNEQHRKALLADLRELEGTVRGELD